MPNVRLTHVVLDQPAFTDATDPVWGGTPWPASWVTCPDLSPGPNDVGYRLALTLAQPTAVRVHVSADERYDLRCNGQRIGRGPHRGDLRHWCYESYDLELPAGEHTLLALVSSPGLDDHLAPSAHLSRAHGFVFAAEGPLADQLNTGRAAWQAQALTGVTHLGPAIHEARFAGGTQRFDARVMNWAAADGQGDGWRGVEVGERAQHAGEPYGELGQVRPLVPSRLPAMMERPFVAGRVRHIATHLEGPVQASQGLGDEMEAWRDLLHRQRPVVIEPHQTRSVLIDLENYFCVYPALTIGGGRDAEVRLDWAEALFVAPDQHAAKAHRDQIEGLYFVGKGDEFLADGERRTFESLWWRAGRYVRVQIETRDEPLTIHGIRWIETRYPLELVALPELADERLSRALPLMERGLLMCMHESYMDTPYYEQLMYVGDTRLDALCTFVRSGDDRLPMRAIELFGESRIDTGMNQARYPSSTPQIIPSFSLWWIAMLHDLALWRGRQDFVASFMPAARSVLEAFRRHLNRDGLYASMPGWNFLDWVPSYALGVPPDGREGVNGAFNWQLVYTLHRKAELEDWLGETQLAGRDRATARKLAAAIETELWDEPRQLYADDLHHRHFSQHTQCLASLSGALDLPRSKALVQTMLGQQDLAQATIYFSHYLFEALHHVGDSGAISQQLELWRALPELGFVTPPETPEPSRSDCHAWGSHPLYHTVASILGLRPASFGFDRVIVKPNLDAIRTVIATVPHPRGEVRARLELDRDQLKGHIGLPPGTHGQLIHRDKTLDLQPGENVIAI